ncbi:MAG TPA: extracellular solute-binding protein, partial [Kofleriaceae bacterium]
DGRWGNFRSAGFRRALTFYLQLFVEQLAPVATEVQISNPWEEMQRGYFASMLHGPWSVGELRRRWTAEMQDQWATAVLPGPSGTGADRPGGALAGGASLVVFRATAHPREAWQLIEYLKRPEVQHQMYELTGDLPPRRASWADPLLAGDGQIQAFRAQLEQVRRPPPLPEWERILTEMRILSERAARQVSPRTTPAQLAAIVDATVTELDRRTDQMLEKRRWILAHELAHEHLGAP